MHLLNHEIHQNQCSIPIKIYMNFYSYLQDCFDVFMQTVKSTHLSTFKTFLPDFRIESLYSMHQKSQKKSLGIFFHIQFLKNFFQKIPQSHKYAFVCYSKEPLAYLSQVFSEDFRKMQFLLTNQENVRCLIFQLNSKKMQDAQSLFQKTIKKILIYQSQAKIAYKLNFQFKKLRKLRIHCFQITYTVYICQIYNQFYKMSKYSVISEKRRLQLIDLVKKEKKTIVSAAKKLKIKISTAKSILYSFEKNGKVLKKKKHLKGQRQKKIVVSNQQEVVQDIKHPQNVQIKKQAIKQEQQMIINSNIVPNQFFYPNALIFNPIWSYYPFIQRFNGFPGQNKQW